MKKIKITLIFVLFISMFSTSCDKDQKFNLFSIEDDKQFGMQFDQEIRNSGEFNILSETQYSEAYSMINMYKNELLKTGKVNYANTFNWTVRIIKDDAVVNAFAVPGGYMYFYTGLIKTLDNEAEFVGVMAHEMAHVACRHSTSQLTKAYGMELLLSLLLGEKSNQWVELAAGLAKGLVELKFSRTDEVEADKYAVVYTYPTEWDARGVADFFKKMDSQDFTPTFLKTHPPDQDRISSVNSTWKSLGEKQGEYNKPRYNQFINSLLK